MKNCPICNHEVEDYHEVTFDKPFVHNNPYDGIMIYGAYSAPKETLCYQDNYLHFAFYDTQGDLTQHRLVKLGVENPTTKSATDEFWENYSEDEDDYDDDFALDEIDPFEEDENGWLD